MSVNLQRFTPLDSKFHTEYISCNDFLCRTRTLKLNDDDWAWISDYLTVFKEVENAIRVITGNFTHTILPAFCELWKTLDAISRLPSGLVRTIAHVVLGELAYYCGVVHPLFFHAMLLDPRQKNRMCHSEAKTRLMNVLRLEPLASKQVAAEGVAAVAAMKEAMKEEVLRYVDDTEGTAETDEDAPAYWERYGKAQFPLLGAIVDKYLVRM